jgi:hypothetical protein
MKRRRKILVSVLALASAAVVVPVLLGAVLSGPIGTQPVRTPEMRILSPLFTAKVGVPIPVRVAFSDFDFQPGMRCSPAGPCTGSSPQTLNAAGLAQGHIHVYIQKGLSIGDPDSVSFCIPPAAVGNVATGTCPAVLERGFYRVSAEFQSNAHVAVLKAENRPQDAPTSDATVIYVR